MDMKNFLKFKTGENRDLRKFGEEYYLREAKLWRPFRIAGLVAIALALPLTVTAILNNTWIYGEDFNVGLWERDCVHLRNHTFIDCSTFNYDWQTAVIGLMIFSASFGFVATILAILGVCTSPLPRKIYYFHSAGEIFLVCALSVGIALIIYPTVMELDPSIQVHLYGPGYGLGWGGAFFFLVAALCMTLDELVRESSRAKCCRFCFKSRQRERSELQRV
ncbi:transmembrane protein 47-like [Argopecten irradians]|uniref:transmembrane protein 47-like n=1 Tax=Argopecten irradians TaxID=31199 RepID=UPI00371C3A4C